MRLNSQADDIRLEADEDGWHLIIDTADGDTINLRVVDPGPIILAAAELLDWAEEGKRLAGEHQRDLDEADAIAASNEVTVLSDPRHPAYLEGADMIRDRARDK